MTPQALVPYIPFFAVLYALFALIQALRHQRQGVMALLLALIGIAAPLVAYALSSDFAVRASLVTYMSINAAVVFVASLLTLWIERRHEKHTPNRSYGMVGIGLSILLVVGMFGLQFATTSTMSAGAPPAFSDTANSADSSVSSSQNTDTTDVQAQADQTTDSTPTEVAQVLEAQTGLSADDIVTQTEAGSTLADLVSAGGMQAQMISRFGSDTTEIATQLVYGTLGQGQQFLLPQLITGASATPPNGQGGDGNFAPPDGSGDFTPPDGSGDFAPPDGSSDTTIPEATEAVSSDTTGSAQVFPTNTTEAQQLAAQNQASEPQAAATDIPTESVIRPTRIVFPTATPTPDAPEDTPIEAETSTVSDETTATCTLMIDYNLNLRDQPTTEGSTVYLSIPFGTSVTTDGVTDDGWYKVTYDGQTGWISGDYVTPQTSCAALTILS